MVSPRYISCAGVKMGMKIAIVNRQINGRHQALFIHGDP